MPSFQQAFILIQLAFAMLADPVPESVFVNYVLSRASRRDMRLIMVT